MNAQKKAVVTRIINEYNKKTTTQEYVMDLCKDHDEYDMVKVLASLPEFEDRLTGLQKNIFQKYLFGYSMYEISQQYTGMIECYDIKVLLKNVFKLHKDFIKENCIDNA